MHRVECCRWRKMAESHQDKLPGRQTRQHIVPLTFQNIAILKHEALEVSQPCLHVSGGLTHVLCFVFGTWDLPVAIRHPSSSLIHSRSPLVIGMLRVRKYALTITSWLILENGVEPIPGLGRDLCSVFGFLGCGKFPLRGRS
jgi:hypothetical protein